MTTPSSLTDAIRPFQRDLAIGGVLLLLTNVAEKLMPWLFRYGVDAIAEGHVGEVPRYAVGLILVAGAAWFVRMSSRVRIFNVGRDVEFDLRNRIVEKLHELGSSYFSRMPTGDLMSRATNDLTQVRLLVGFGGLNVVNSVLAFGSAIALMLAISPQLTLYGLAPFPFVALAAMGFSRATFRRSLAAQAAIAKVSDRVQEQVAGIRIVRSLGLEDVTRARFESANREAVDTNMALVLLRGLMWPVLMGLASLGTLIVIWQGGQLVLDRTLTAGQFAAFLAYLAQLVWPTLALGYLLAVVQRGRASFNRVKEILDAKPDIAETPSARPAPTGGRLEVRDLSFEIGKRKVLDGVSFEVPAETTLAIVGLTGSGKSVLAALLPRLLSTPPNTVFLDGVDVTDISLRSLRHRIGYAQQDAFLFSTTVRANLAFALDGEDLDRGDADERMRRALADAAVLADVEAMTDGVETVVGERGVQLSGGQKQRVALARALLGDPRVLVLDDPLSAVDAETEKSILEALDHAKAGRTLVLVTHRIAAAARADSVIVLDRGKIVQCGSHEELLREGGLYARLAEKQRLERELEAERGAA